MIIISPHNDDLLIGCFKLIINKKIKYAYFLDFEGNRLKEKEAKIFCRDFKIKILNRKEELERIVRKYITLVPSPYSHHPLHRWCSGWVYSLSPLKLGWYSTDMIEFWINKLSLKEVKLKRKLLNKYFKLEKELWRYDKKYYLFEGVIVEV